MTAEILFPEFSNLFGDMANMRYFKSCAPDIEFVYTDKNSTPRFVTDSVDMIYIGAMTENKQEMAVKQLMPYRDKLKDLIESGTVILATGNAEELFGSYIEEDGKKTEMLNIFPFYAKRNRKIEERHNSMFLGEFEDIKIVGCRSQFSFCYGDFKYPFINVLGGFGNNPDDKTEGIHYKNFFSTYLLGPFLVLNPLFTKYILRLLGHDDSLAFEQDAINAYDLRLSELDREDADFSVKS